MCYWSEGKHSPSFHIASSCVLVTIVYKIMMNIELADMLKGIFFLQNVFQFSLLVTDALCIPLHELEWFWLVSLASRSLLPSPGSPRRSRGASSNLGWALLRESVTVIARRL